MFPDFVLCYRAHSVALQGFALAASLGPRFKYGITYNRFRGAQVSLLR